MRNEEDRYTTRDEIYYLLNRYVRSGEVEYLEAARSYVEQAIEMEENDNVEYAEGIKPINFSKPVEIHGQKTMKKCDHEFHYVYKGDYVTGKRCEKCGKQEWF